MSSSQENNIFRELEWEKMKYSLVKNYLENTEIGSNNKNNFLLETFPEKLKSIYKEDEESIKMIKKFLECLITASPCGDHKCYDSDIFSSSCNYCCINLLKKLNDFDINKLYLNSIKVCECFLTFIKIFITPPENININ